MDQNEITKFPALMENKLVAEELKTLKFMSDNIKTVETNLASFIAAVQKDCQHEWKEESGEFKVENSRFEENGNTSYSMTVFDSGICKFCGLQKPN